MTFKADKFHIWVGLVWWPLLIAFMVAVWFCGYTAGAFFGR